MNKFQQVETLLIAKFNLTTPEQIARLNTYVTDYSSEPEIYQDSTVEETAQDMFSTISDVEEVVTFIKTGQYQ